MRCPEGLVGHRKCVYVCLCVHMAAASNIYKEAAVPLATAIVSNYILVSLDTHSHPYAHTHARTHARAEETERGILGIPRHMLAHHCHPRTRLHAKVYAAIREAETPSRGADTSTPASLDGNLAGGHRVSGGSAPPEPLVPSVVVSR